MSTLAIQQPVPLPNSTTGAHMYAQGFGTWQATRPGEVYEAVKAAIQAGYRLIDCAKIYLNQEEVGRAIAEVVAAGVVKRSDLFVVSKVWNTDHAPEHVAASTAQSIADLQVGYLDLLLIHWPVAFKHTSINSREFPDLFPKNEATGGCFMADIPQIETYRAMEALVKAGSVRHIGLSNFSIAEVTSILDQCEIKPVANQIEVHPANPNKALRDFCTSRGIVTMAYCPLGIGMQDPALGLLSNPEIVAIAKAAGAPSAASLLLQWASQVGTVCLSKSTTPERIAANAATPFGALSADTMVALAAFGEKNQFRVCNPNFFRAEGGDFFAKGE